MNIDPSETTTPQQDEKLMAEAGLMNALKNFGKGVIAGSGTIFVEIIITQFFALGTYWFGGSLFFSMIALIGALVLGVPAGGLGGLILGSIWKNRKAAMVGGIMAALMLAPVIFIWFSSCALLGGC